MTETDLLRSALAHAARGWRVFPLRPSDKRPAVRDWEARATLEEARIRKAWSQGRFNIGLACGPSGLVVIDLDTPDHGGTRPSQWDRPGIRDGADVLAALADEAGQPAPFETLSVQITSGGEHLYFTVPSGSRIRNSAGRLGWLVDVRAAGGYVVAAGSVIRNRRYRAAEAEVQELPAWIAKQLGEPARQAPSLDPLIDVVGRRSRYVAAALRGELDAVLAAHPGSGRRNDTLNRAAFALGQLVDAGLLPECLATAALAEASAAIGLSPREAHATIRSGLVAGIRCPRRLPAAGEAE